MTGSLQPCYELLQPVPKAWAEILPLTREHDARLKIRKAIPGVVPPPGEDDATHTSALICRHGREDPERIGELDLSPAARLGSL